MKYLVLILFCLLFLGYKKNTDKLLARVEIIERNGDLYLSYEYDKGVYRDKCEVLLQLALEARASCDYSYLKDKFNIDTVKTKTKKL